MDRIKYGLAFGPKHGSLLICRPTSVLKILWAYSWAGPLMSVKSRGPLAGVTPTMWLYLPRVEARLRGITAL